MDCQQIGNLVREMNVDTVTGSVDQPIQQNIVGLGADLLQAIDELDIRSSGVWRTLEYINAGQACELDLRVAGLGYSPVLHADQADIQEGAIGGTPLTIEGLWCRYTRTGRFFRMDDGSKSEDVKTLIIEGTVTDTDAQLIEDAQVETWHTNGLGNYSLFDKSQSEFNLRRMIFTDQDGQYVAQTTIPVGYGCSSERNTQALLNKLGRYGIRPSHVHYCVSALDCRKLTTQFNIERDQYLWDDFAFATCKGLVTIAVEVTDPAENQHCSMEKPLKFIRFNFTLLKEVENAPAAEVEHRHLNA